MTYLPVEKSGLVDLERLKAEIRPDTSLVSIMAVNNEIGVLQPIAEIGKICRERKVFFHTDAAQAAGKIPMDVNAMNIDLMSISGHKARLGLAGAAESGIAHYSTLHRGTGGANNSCTNQISCRTADDSVP